MAATRRRRTKRKGSVMRVGSIGTLAVAVLAGVAHAAWSSPLPSKPVLTLEAAKRVAAAAEAEATKRGATVVIVVVDEGGHVLFLERLNDTQVASVDVGIGKARTAAIFRRPSKVFEDQIREGRVAALALPGATPLQGGVPLLVGDRVVGAIGVSGNTPQEDEDIAKAGAAAFAALLSAEGAQPDVSYWKNDEVEAAFAKGSVLFDGEDGRNYMVHASHRESPGMAEVHELDADIIYVLEGSATFVTGGTVESGKTTAPNEIRGTSIRNGDVRRIAKGDVLIVPAGTPHWFKDVAGPLNYYVVKVRP
jgi:glc operon protein GlcG